MEVLIGEAHPLSNAKCDNEQAAKILEEAAEVFCAWRDYDRAMVDGICEEMVELCKADLLDECADLIFACVNMSYSIMTWQDSFDIGEPDNSCLEKDFVRSILDDAACVHHDTFELELLKSTIVNSTAKEREDARETLAISIKCLLVHVCELIAALGESDFRPYMESCEQRNKESL